MEKNISFHRIIPFVILCIILVTCRPQTDLKIVPIREAEFRDEQFLPLNSCKIKEIVEFIADGGRQKNDGFQANVKHEHFRRFLLLFTEEGNLTYGAFKALPALKEFIDTEFRVRDVIDAREEKGPKGINRLAYRYKDFWFVFMVDELHTAEGPILDNDRKFSRIIVMQVLDRTEKTK